METNQWTIDATDLLGLSRVLREASREREELAKVERELNASLWLSDLNPAYNHVPSDRELGEL